MVIAGTIRPVHEEDWAYLVLLTLGALAAQPFRIVPGFCLGIHRVIDAYVTDVTRPRNELICDTDPAKMGPATAFRTYVMFFTKLHDSQMHPLVMVVCLSVTRRA
jgi:hypothetical protein